MMNNQKKENDNNKKPTKKITLWEKINTIDAVILWIVAAVGLLLWLIN